MSIISQTEWRALKRIRNQLARGYWTYYTTALLACEIHRRVWKTGAIAVKLRRAHRIPHNKLVASVIKHAVRHHFPTVKIDKDLEQLDVQDIQCFTRPLHIYTFACVDSDPCALATQQPERLIPNVPNPINFWRIRKRLLRLGRDLQNIFVDVRYTVILDFSELRNLYILIAGELCLQGLDRRIDNYADALTTKLRPLGITTCTWKSARHPQSSDDRISHSLIESDQHHLQVGSLLRRLRNSGIALTTPQVRFLARGRVYAYAAQGKYLSNHVREAPTLLIVNEFHHAHKVQMLRAWLRPEEKLPMACV
jgi:hypothetical protein